MSTPAYVRRLRGFIGRDLLLLPGVSAIVRDSTGRMLLLKRRDVGVWSLPGGILEPNESLLEALKREVFEETGIRVGINRCTGIYSDPASNVVTYPNGDRVHFVIAAFLCRPRSGRLLSQSDEASDLQYFPPNRLPKPMTFRVRQRIRDALTRKNPRVT